MNETVPSVLLKFIISYHAETGHTAPYIIELAAWRELSSSENCMNLAVACVLTLCTYTDL